MRRGVTGGVSGGCCFSGGWVRADLAESHIRSCVLPAVVEQVERRDERERLAAARVCAAEQQRLRVPKVRRRKSASLVSTSLPTGDRAVEELRKGHLREGEIERNEFEKKGRCESGCDINSCELTAYSS